MLKILLKKQLTEVFRSFYYNPKKNTARTRAATVGMVVLYALLMVFVIGGMFAVLGWVTCGPLAEAGVGWLYFILFGLAALLFGTLGSVFSTFSGLYLSKDNDLLLAMPIPVRTILLARVLNVYLIGLLYVVPVLLPATVIYWIFGVCSVGTVLGGLLLLVLVSLIVLLLSCLLGWVVAKLSLRLKSKSFVVVLIALAGIGVYYFLYFKAQALLRELVANAAVYGAKVKGSVYVLYLFGRIGEGDWLGALLWTAGIALLTVPVWLLLHRTFLKIATATAAQKKAVYREKAARQGSADRALLVRELRRFASSANVMLNCGLSVFLLPLAGVALLIYGGQLGPVLNGLLGAGTASVLLCAALCMLSSMLELSAVSVSLEGSALWLAQSLPVTPWQVLRAKLRAHLLLCLPLIFAAVCGAIAIEATLPLRLLTVGVALLAALLGALFGQFMNLHLPVLRWTSEMSVVKQSGSVGLTLLAEWGGAALLAGLYFAFGRLLGATLYLALAAVCMAAACVPLYLWLRRKGAACFAEL